MARVLGIIKANLEKKEKDFIYNDFGPSLDPCVCKDNKCIAAKAANTKGNK